MTAAVHTMIAGDKRVVLNVRAVGTGDSDTVLLDISTLTGVNGAAAPTKISIEDIWWSVDGFDYAVLEFDRTTDYVIDYFKGQGYIDYKPSGGKVDKGTGQTGDLLLTTSGGAATSTVTMLISVKLKY